MISSEYEWLVRIRKILQQRLGTGKEHSLPVAEEIVTLIREDRYERSQFERYRQLEEQEEADRPAWQAAERRLTSLAFRLALVQLLAVLLAVLLLA